ncbi:MAG TPA: lamin tail domain-containing protein [Mycobacteriales bacterium]|nr:lamin tail domain-containing protein [Mycobacteriales bacterium]
MTGSLVAITALAAGLLIVAPSAHAAGAADLVITELAYGGNAAYGGDSGDGEYVELTNIGGAAQDVSGWFFDSSSSTTISAPSPTAGVSLATLADGSGTNTVVAPGESVIVTDLTPADFRTEWGLTPSVKVVNDGAFTLKKSGSVYISTGTAVLDQVSYNLATPGKGVSAWVSAGNVGDQQTAIGSAFTFATAATGTSNGWTVSTVGDSEGSWKSAGGSVGSPAASTLGTSTPTSVRASSLAVAGGSNQTATVGHAFSFTGLTASGGTPPYAWSAPALSGTGLSIDPTTGAITGTPTSAGTIGVTATATDSANTSASASFTITVGTGIDPNWSNIVINEVTSDNNDNSQLTSNLPPALYAALNTSPNSASDLVELYNKGDQAVDITGWKQIDSHAASSATDFSGRLFDVNGNKITSIPAHGYGVFQSGQGLGSGGDAVKLYLPDGTLVDSVTFGAGQAGYDESLDPQGLGPMATTEVYHTIARCPDGAGAVNTNTNDVPASSWYSVKVASFGSSNDSSCDTSTDPTAAVQYYNEQPPTGLPSTCSPSAPSGSDTIAVPDAVAWPTTDGVSTADNQCEFITPQDPTGNDMSSLVFNNDGSVLWGAQNKNHIWKLVKDPVTGKFLPATDNDWGNGKGITFSGTDPSVSQPDDEGLTVGGNGDLFVTSERDNVNSNVSKDEVLEYDPNASGTTLAPVQQWDLTSEFVPSVIAATGGDSNLGFEGVTYVPDSFLTAHGFHDQNLNKVYDPADYPLHGSGLFFLGLEKNGHVYAYALNSDGSYQRVADIDTGIDGTSAIADLQFNADDQGIWTDCDNDCGVVDSLLRIDAHGNFTRVVSYNRPAGLPDDNLEGFAIAPASTAVNGEREVVWSDDGIYGEGNAWNSDHTGNAASADWGHALYSGTIPLSVAPNLPDLTPPTITFSGNAGTYGVLGTVAISATATDSGSGVASLVWTNVNAPAYSFGPGPHTLTATATDNAGNTTTATTTFTVTVTPADLSTLTAELVQGSAKYKSSNALIKLAVNALVKVVTSIELQLTPKVSPAAKNALLNAYASSVQALVSGAWLTASQAATLIGLAGAL